MALIRVRDDMVRERVISSVKKSFESGKHPLTGAFLKKKILTEREIKTLIDRVDQELRKELMEDPLPEMGSAKPKEKPIRCMYLDKIGTGCLASTTYREGCSVEVRKNRNCPLPIERSIPGSSHRLTTEYCRQRSCPSLKKREMNNTLECELTRKVPGNMAECPLKDDPGNPSPGPSEPEIHPGSRIQGQGFEPADDRLSGMVRRAISKSSPNGLVPFTVHAGRHEMATVRNLLKYGDALDEDEAIQTMFEDGAALWLDKIERRIQEEGISDFDE
jgi:hypothetical protein